KSDIRTVSVKVQRPADGSTTPDAEYSGPLSRSGMAIGPSCSAGSAAVADSSCGLGPGDSATGTVTGPCRPGSSVTVAVRPSPSATCAERALARSVASAAFPGGSATSTDVTASTATPIASSAKTLRRNRATGGTTTSTGGATTSTGASVIAYATVRTYRRCTKTRDMLASARMHRNSPTFTRTSCPYRVV